MNRVQCRAINSEKRWWTTGPSGVDLATAQSLCSVCFCHVWELENAHRSVVLLSGFLLGEGESGCPEGPGGQGRGWNQDLAMWRVSPGAPS